MIDGYNVIYVWPKLKEVFRLDPNTACTQLTNAVQFIHDSESLNTTVVFDGKDHDNKIELSATAISFLLVYTKSGLTADRFIEQYVQKHNRKQMFIIVSRNSLLIETTASLDAEPLRNPMIKKMGRAMRQSTIIENKTIYEEDQSATTIE